jgi:hypothetical protein
LHRVAADRLTDIVPSENSNPEAILEAIKKVGIVSELLAKKFKSNLKMIAEGKVSGGKQIGPDARLLSFRKYACRDFDLQRSDRRLCDRGPAPYPTLGSP